MELTHFLIVVFAALFFLVPMMHKEQASERQAQEASPYEEIMEGPDTYSIVYEVKRPQEEPLADIIWMKKAAEVAKAVGVPYFNVLRQVVTKQFVEKYNRELSVVEGTIKVEKDPMEAEFDAQEIESLVLTEIP